MHLSPANFRAARLAAGLSQRATAIAAGVDVKTIQRAEAGTHETGANALGRIAQVYGVPVDDLYDKDTSPALHAATR